MPAPKIIPRYTAEDYRQWEGDWELWDGIPIAMTPSPFGPHQRLLAKLSQHFLNALDVSGCRDCQVFIELDWIVDAHTVIRPDLSIVCGVEVDEFIRQPPQLVVEILSSSTSQRDQVEKRALYLEQGVRHYLIADPATRQIKLSIQEAKAQEEFIDSKQSFQLSKTCQIQVNFERL